MSLPLLWVLGGCYTYRPVDSVQPGMDIRARLSNEAAIQRSAGLAEPIRHIDGQLVEASNAAVAIDVLVARSSSAFRDVVIRDTVRLERSEIQEILEQRISPARTAFLVVGLGAGAALLAKGIAAAVGGNEGEPIDPPDPANVVPIFSLGRSPAGAWVLRLPFW